MQPELFPQDPILLVDDEEQALLSYALTLRYNGYTNTLRCQDSRQVKDILARQPVSLALVDLHMPHVSGEEILAHMAQEHPDVPAIVVTGYHEVERVVRCMRAGSMDYLVKPVEPARLLAAVASAVELRREKLRAATLPDDTGSGPGEFAGILSASPAMRAVFRYAAAVAKSPEPALITGETGVGKEMVARALHTASGRAGRFVAVNAAGLDDAVFADTLFGHQRGAFTGADRPRTGLVEQAAGGTLFLDEIGDLSLASQLKLLRLLQEREYYPVGADTPKQTDARVVVATNLTMEALLNPARFRRDLFYRLRTHHIALPPLRERMGDVPLLLDHFLAKAAASLGVKPPARPRELVELLGAHPFPGNVRELEAMVFDAVARHASGKLSLTAFREWISLRPAPAQGAPAPDGHFGTDGPPASNGHPGTDSQAWPGEGPQAAFAPGGMPTLKQAEEALVDKALRLSGGNQSAAARYLGISRQALSKRLAVRKKGG